MKFYWQPFLLVLLLSSCVGYGIRERGNGDMVTETYNVSDFDKVQIGGAYDVLLVPSSRERVEVEIDENLLEYLEVGTHGRTLEIRNTETIVSEKGIDVVIYFRELEEIYVSGACNIEAEDLIKGDRLTIDMSGAGAIDLEVDLEELELDISGAGAVKLEGVARHQRIRMSGAGGYSGYDLESRTCDIEISGVGSADIYVERELYATIGGLGGISYKGGPDKVESNVSGLGAIKRAD